MSLRQKTAKGVLWNALGTWTAQGVNFVVLLVLARLLDPVAFGLVALANVFVSLAGMIADQGLTAALIQRKEIDDRYCDTAFWASVVTGVVFGGAFVASAGLIERALAEPGIAAVVSALAVLLLVAPFEKVPAALLSRALDFRALNIRSMVAAAAGGVVGIGLAAAGFGVWSLVGQQVTRALVGAVTVWLYARWTPRMAFDRDSLRALIRFGIPTMGSDLLQFVKQQGDKLVVGALLGTTALGLYTVAVSAVYNLKSLLVGVVFRVSFPVFSRLQHERERLRTAFVESVRVASLVAFPVFAGVALVAVDLLPALFGEQWASAYPVMRWIALAAIVQAVQPFAFSLILGTGHASWKLGLEALQAFVGLALMVLLARWGLAGIAASVLIAELTLVPVTLYAVGRLIDLRAAALLAHLRTALTSTVGMTVAVLASLALVGDAGLPALARLAITVTIGALVFGGLALAQERALITGTFRHLASAAPKP